MVITLPQKQNPVFPGNANKTVLNLKYKIMRNKMSLQLNQPQVNLKGLS